MKIKGHVSVYEVIDGRNVLVQSEPNLIVDGAGAAIVDMLTMPSSTATDSDVFDTSNYVVQAVSFGKASAVFTTPLEGAHIYSNTLSAEYAAETYMKAFHSASGGTGASSVNDPSSLPTYPDPTNSSLEVSTTTQYELSVGNTSTSNGHSLNRMHVNVNPSSIFMGCYAPSGGIDLYIISGNMEESSAVTFSSNVVGHYNTLGTMDNAGFLSCAYWPDSEDNTKGCIVSGTTPITTANVTTSAPFLLNPAVSYNFTLSAPDKQMLNAYGGITQLGLWTIDVKETLANEAAPFTFTTDEDGTSNRVYRLFSKKTFAENLARTNQIEWTGFVDIFIEWKISFDFGSGSWA